MADDAAVRRRELRRRNILVNAEARKRKIFGLNRVETDEANLSCTTGTAEVVSSSQDVDTSLSDPTTDQTTCDNQQVRDSHQDEVTLDKTEDTDTVRSSNEENVTRKVTEIVYNQDKRDDTRVNSREEQHPIEQIGPEASFADNATLSYLQNNETPLGLQTLRQLINESSNMPTELDSSGSLENIPNTSSDLKMFSQPFGPAILALFVSVMLYINMGYIVSNSFIVPFFLWELQRFYSSYGEAHKDRNKMNLLNSALLLCGIQQNVFSKYFYILNIIRCISEEFAIYLFFIVIWQLTIGYPDELSTVVDEINEESVPFTAT